MPPLAEAPTPSRPPQRNRARRLWPALAAGLLVGVTLLVAAVTLVTRTAWGRERILALTLRAVGGKLNGTLSVERLEGDLFTGARLYGIVLAEPDGSILVRADSAYVDYRLPSFFGGDVAIGRLVAYDAAIFLRRLPTDSLWNYQQVLLDTTAAAGPGRATLIDRLRLVNASVRVQLPWTPTKGLSPAQQRVETRDALSDTSRLVVTRVPGGYLRTILMSARSAEASRVTIAPDERGGNFLRVEGASGRVALYRGQPLVLRDVRGELAQRQGVVRFDAPEVRLPASRLSAQGSVDLRQEEPIYDVVVRTSSLALRDAQWLYPPLPERGSASFRLLLQTRRRGDYYRVDSLRLALPGTRVAGRFAMVVGDSVLFQNLALRAQPLDVATVERMLPTQLPVRGLHIGTVEIRSPAS